MAQPDQLSHEVVETCAVLMNRLPEPNRPLNWRVALDFEGGEKPLMAGPPIALEGNVPGFAIEKGGPLRLEPFEVVVARIELGEYPGKGVGHQSVSVNVMR